MSPVTPHQFALLRLLLGGYVLAYVVQLLPYGAELFSRAGMLPEAQLNGRGLEGLNVLAVWDAPWSVTLFLAVMAAAAAAFAAGIWPRALAVMLWYGWACMDNRNIFTLTPSLPYVGWMVLACAALPAHGRGFPRALWVGGWVLLALGYTVSGLGKLGSPSWDDGSVLARLAETPLWRAWPPAQWVASWPDGLLRAAAWGTLGLELAFAPLALWRRTRPWVWSAMVAWHAALLALVDLAYINVGMLLMHLWTFDARWCAPRPGDPPPVVFFDGVCGLCNRFIDFLLAEDTGWVLRYAPLQGETAAGRLSAEDRNNLATLVYADEAGLHRQSSAAVRILDRIGGIWRPVSWLLWVVPKPLRDLGYRMVAGNRYRLFGKHETCRLPTPEERGRLLP